MLFTYTLSRNIHCVYYILYKCILYCVYNPIPIISYIIFRYPIHFTSPYIYTLYLYTTLYTLSYTTYLYTLYTIYTPYTYIPYIYTPYIYYTTYILYYIHTPYIHILYPTSITAHLKFQHSLGPNVTTTLIPDSAVGRNIGLYCMYDVAYIIVCKYIVV